MFTFKVIFLAWFACNYVRSFNLIAFSQVLVLVALGAIVLAEDSMKAKITKAEDLQGAEGHLGVYGGYGAYGLGYGHGLYGVGYGHGYGGYGVGGVKQVYSHQGYGLGYGLGYSGYGLGYGGYGY